MAYTKYVYTRTNWKNKSESLETPLGKTNLNHIESGIYNIAENLDVSHNELDAKKFNKSDANKVIAGMPTWNPDTGVLTFKFYDGTTFQVDFNIEKIPVSFSMDSAGVITMTTADGTQWTADIGDVIPTYTFTDSETIAFSDAKNGGYEHSVSAEVRAGSIKEKHLQPNYLADIKAQASNAAASANAASGYADNAAYDAKLSQSYAIGGSGIRAGEDTDNSKYHKEQANGSASSAAASASAASASASTASQKAIDAANSQSAAATSEANAKTSETNAKESENAAKTSAANTKTSETNAKASETAAAQSASTASQKATDASNSATAAQNYAVGSTNSSKYYYEQSKSISESFSGALRPMGTVAFANLPPVSSATEGDMYNISDQFTTTADFKEGAGNVVPAGANVYRTADAKWDVLAGNPVTGVKGNAESSYRRGNVNITPANLGINVVNNTADANKNVATANQVNGTYTGRGGQQPPSYVTSGKTRFNMWNGFKGITNPSGGYMDVILMDNYTGSDVPFVTGIGVTKNNGNPRMFVANGAKGGTGNWAHQVEVITSGNIASQAVASATKATQDGNGNNIADTYAKKSLYGDTEINVGRLAGTTVGAYSATEGYRNTASGDSSHAEGSVTTASGVRSHAEGNGTKASSPDQHVQGKYNVEDTKGKYAHIVGGGDFDTRSNIHTLDWDGNAEYAGDVTGHDSSGNAISLSGLNGSLAELSARQLKFAQIEAAAVSSAPINFSPYFRRANVPVTYDALQGKTILCTFLIGLHIDNNDPQIHHGLSIDSMHINHSGIITNVGVIAPGNVTIRVNIGILYTD